MGTAPVLGREAELAALDAAYAAAEAGTGGTVVVSGPAGIGKTSLVAVAQRRYADRGALVLAGPTGRYPLRRPPTPRSASPRRAG
ncbi:MAG: hypothetical protein AUI14_05095 [Actinobacteria bacterium 13_2_20CM_2_71_6]|nr:MAG: hypothetical protein AUI14_05095 [Actinobacteria bacterium 13_2_20CM_2_71_6]